ncbi:carbon-nitrogen hydrolase family protein [Pseudohalocynthiibacter aestuariivivens]|uniref:Carbon-nitrogen hydrolase family protein n=1 Tax=Pseudohalocynthiibacter aestuariivivens TaxID=1591409 RepID=A0ABV5JAQ3_9RHOB|nr:MULTISPECIES: carbon-nitrogen hydrolase family protein [Pseudohalocynthiibacter]MBS9715914.1 carbon-nitrogen hydrolase family protein [Pseudohalocynthiibacter aestuariivivens]MCK0101527.1 carbon-nitrogen hydrolase family protein [Pseudohalocynthiibacter sp. F2068]
MKIATAAYPIDWHDDWSSYEKKLANWVGKAADAGADLLVFPEYGAMELASLAGAEQAGDLAQSLIAVSDLMSKVHALHSLLAVKYGAHILGGSGPVVTESGIVNRAAFYSPDGQKSYQDKQIMTRFERDPMRVSSGGPLTVFETAIGRIGVLICYDCEFPELARVLIENDVEILLAPSCTEALSGYWRVRIGAMARALESQCIVVHSPLVGASTWNPVVEMNTGAAAIYGPPDMGFPDNGVIAEGALNIPGWVYADVSLEAVRVVRKDGRVLNVKHWEEQAARLGNVKIASLMPKTS